jgi:hypothetical protein
VRRTALLAAATAGLALAALTAPASANEVRKFEGKIAAPLPVVSNELAAMESMCPDGGEADGSVYKFFDLKADYKHFYVSGPKLIVNQPEPTGVKGGNYQDYDFDLYLFNAKCKVVDGDGPINKQMGVGALTAARPARYAAINYYAGPYVNIPVTLEASNSPIKK